MPLYVAVHSPMDEERNEVAVPADLEGLARGGGPARWLRTLSPDLHDERHITIWDANSADDVGEAMRTFHFFAEYDTVVFRAKEWGPDDVLSIRRDDGGRLVE